MPPVWAAYAFAILMLFIGGILTILSRTREDLAEAALINAIPIQVPIPASGYDFSLVSSNIADIGQTVKKILASPPQVIHEEVRPVPAPNTSTTVYKVEGGDIVGVLGEHTKLLEQLAEESNLRTSILVSTHKTETGEDVSQVRRI